MSVGPIVAPADLPASRLAASRRGRVWVRALSFSALALYGVQRWGQLMRDPPGWRLVGLAALAIAFAVLVPLVRHLVGERSPHGGRVAAGALAVLLGLAMLPVAGLRWRWVIHARVAACVHAIGHGLGALGNVLVPYLGHGYSIRLVMVLGAALLLLDAAFAVAYAGRPGTDMGDGRRAAAALPLIALAVVPATLVPPAFPALQGLLLFLLLAAFLWGERVASDGVAAAVAVACAAGVVGALLGPAVEPSRAWVDYRDWAGSSPAAVGESFDWNQSYGPLHWPQDGRVVFTVHARRGEYWKAQDLTRFDGSAWVAAAQPDAPALPSPTAAARRRYSELLTVTLASLRSRDVIGAGATSRPELQDGVAPGAVPGTWVANRPLGPAQSYTVDSYSPDPSGFQLSQPGAYPWARLADDLSLTLPVAAGSASGSPTMTTLTFPAFHTPLSAAMRTELKGSRYAPALALARRLAAHALTPYAFVAAVQSDLDAGQYRYDQSTVLTQYPLLSFLFTTHQGYCQQFSGAMALLLRMGGVPARVAAGFTPGAPNPTRHTWTVADLDAHAWVEVWFPRYGWVKFDPTPTSAPARGGSGTGAGTAIAPIQRSRNLPQPRGGTLAGRTHGSAAKVHHGRASAGSVTRNTARRSGGDPWPWIGAAIALAALLGAGLALLRARRRPRAGPDPLDELQRALERTGHAPRDGTTLVTLEGRFAQWPEAASYIRALRLRRYGGDEATPSPAGRRALRGALGAERGVAGRLRALRALPPRPWRAPAS